MTSPLKLLLFLSLCPIYESNGFRFSCSPENFQQCMASLQQVMQSEQLAFAATREELNDVCQQLQDAMRCVDEHTEKCFSSSQRNVFNSVVSGSRQVIEDLCVTGSVQDKYLRYAKCFKNVSTDERKCASKYRRIVYLAESEETTENVEEALKKTCCAFTDFVQCQHTHVVEDCGQDAGHFLQRHSDRMSGSLIHQHCAQYTYGFSTCSTSANVVAIQMWTILSALIVSTMCF